MTGTTQGGKKAAETRGHDSLSKAGAKGGKNSSSSQGKKNSDSTAREEKK